MEKSLFALLVGVCLIALAAPVGRAETWTVAHAIGVSLARNPDVEIADARTRAADALLQQAEGGLWPQLSIGPRYTGTNSAMQAFGAILNQRAFSPALDFNHPGTVDDLNATGTVAYGVYAGGRMQAGRRAARAGAQAAAYDAMAAARTSPFGWNYPRVRRWSRSRCSRCVSARSATPPRRRSRCRNWSRSSTRPANAAFTTRTCGQ